MKFSEVVTQTLAWLQRDGRVSYRALKREFDLDDEYIEDLKAELIEAKRLAIDENGKVLVWIGKGIKGEKDQGINGESEGERKDETAKWVKIEKDAELRAANSEPNAAERRQLTVMFCDLVGSTALSAQLDPEELREVVRSYQETCTAVIRRYEGHIAQLLGDGLLVYFGYPTAHEDDAARAVRAGLEVLVALRSLASQHEVPSPFQREGQGEGNGAAQSQASPRPNPLPKKAKGLKVRIGIHTGIVVIGEIGSSEKREILALGETPNLAARIQGQANPDEVLISAATYRLVEGLFECEDRGQPELKGVTTSLTLYRVVKDGEAHSRFEVVVRRGLTPLIGREHEFGLLQERWARVKDGAGQVVLLSGEPGIGKSRLVEALKETVEHEGTRFLELRCSPYTQNSAFASVIEHLQRTLQLRLEDTAEEKLRKLEVWANRRAPLQPEAISILAALLSLPHPEGRPALTFSPQKQKEKTYETLVTWLRDEAKQQPVVLAWEDLHWADPSTLELLTLFLAQVPTTRVLAVFTYRPEFTPPWSAHSYLSQCTLSRLGRNHVETMIEEVSGGKALPAEVVLQIVNKTDGVPLFVEELTKSAVEVVGTHGRASLQLFDIPSTLQDALMARLDRLGTAKEIAQIGATIGREFNYTLLKVVSPLNEESLQQGLKQLVESELVFQSGMPPQARYLFKHALVQDTAYQSLLKSRRQQLHQSIGKELEEQFLETVETQPELVAHHYTEAALIEHAIPYWQRAGELASKRLALKEAIAHLSQGMALISTLPPSPERDGKELDLRTRLGMAWIALQGWGASEVQTSLYPALGLAKSLSRYEALLPIYWGLWVYVMVQGRVAESLIWVNDMLVTAEASGEADLLIGAHWAAGITHFWRGDVSQSHAHDDRVLALYDEEQHRYLADLMNTDPKSDVGIHGSLGTWVQGYPDRAVYLGEANEAHVRRRGHLFDLGWALSMGGLLWDLRREPMRLLMRAEEAERLGRAHSLPFISDVLAQVMKGIAWLRAGRLAEGILQLRCALEMWNAHGGEVWMPYWRVVLAEGLTLNGDLTGGLRLVEESLTQIARPGWEERWALAEILRIKGWMLTLQSNLTDAEKTYIASLDVAHEQQAKSWELRTSTSLARLWQQQGKQAKAHKLLSDVYNWFTEGFDTKDLQEAKTLLAELSD